MNQFDTVSAIAEAWSNDFIRFRLERLRKHAGGSKKLANSLKAAIFKDAQAGIMLIQIRYSDYGRYIDMKKLERPEGGTVIDELEAWVKSKGLANKRFKGQSRTANQIAWGILKSKKKPRRFNWMAGKNAAFATLYNDIASGLIESTTDQLTQKMKNG